jgi:catechol 2,3-dioxygenase-like lactoylglutathione lyase family enzyme
MSDTGIQNLVEAALYVDDLDQAETFYRDVLGLELIMKEPGRHVFFRAGQGVLLIFNPETTSQGGNLPSHGAKGPGHAALGIAADSPDFWRSRLQEHGIQIERDDLAQGRAITLLPRSSGQLHGVGQAGLLGTAVWLVR